MTTINLATDIPPAIETLEQLAAWALLSLHALHKSKTYKEAEGSSIDSGLSPLVDASIVSAADGTTRIITRTALELDAEYVTDATKKLWLFAREIGQTALPAAFKVD